MINFVIEENWKWNCCKLPIKRCNRNNKKKEEEYFFQVFNYEDIQFIKQGKANVTLDKSFPFEADTGFVWHKSWNLPEITVEICQDYMNLVRDQYHDVGCEIMSVFPVKIENTYYLHEVCLEGTAQKQIQQNRITFKFLKFGETSFNHSRNKFSLLIWIYGQNSHKDRDDIFCLISSPIYVDSRKQARKKQIQVSNNAVLYSIKKFSAPIGGIKGLVNNSSEGFINYYSAQNIRNKIKHPFYIAYHFDRVFKLYFNGQEKIELVDVLSVIELAKLLENGTKNGEEKLLMVEILECNEKINKKIVNIVEKWKFGLIQYKSQNNCGIEQKWKLITKQQIKSTYKSYYDHQISKENEGINKDNNNNNEDGNQYFDEVKNNCGQRDINYGYLDEKSNEYVQKQKQKQRTYQLRTIIELSQPKKKRKTNCI